MLKNVVRTTLLTLIVLGVLPATNAAAQSVQDVVTVASGSGVPGGTVDVPVLIRDVSGSSLGIDQPPGSRIQSYSLKVDYAPASAVQSITFSRAGITAPLTPTFESSPSAPGSVSLLDTFQEATNLIPFVSNAAAPGNQVAHLLVHLSPSLPPGTTVTLTLDPLLTQLTDQAGSGATKESVANGNLALGNGAITVATSAPTLSAWALVLLAVSLAIILAIRLR